MDPFEYVRVERPADAVAAVANRPGTKFLAGGTNLVDLMKERVERPERLVDVNRLPLAAITELPGGGLRLGALARNSEVADHPLVRERYPVLSEALLAGATPQLRNAATVGGNLLQRTRCPYFGDTTWGCNKREPGTGCSALEGHNRSHAILGTSEHCVATHASDMCVALAALGGVVRLLGPTGEREVPFADFHLLPGDTPHRETVLGRDELIIAVDVPAVPFAKRSHYLKVRDRASYAFALASAAVALDVQDGIIRASRVALGGVATKPWRSAEAEQALAGAKADAKAFRAAADAALRGAKTLEHNAFKLELAKRTLARALATAAAL